MLLGFSIVLSFSTVRRPNINGTRGSASPWHWSTGISLLVPITDYTDTERWFYPHISGRMERKAEIHTSEMCCIPSRESSWEAASSSERQHLRVSDEFSGLYKVIMHHPKHTDMRKEMNRNHATQSVNDNLFIANTCMTYIHSFTTEIMTHAIQSNPLHRFSPEKSLPIQCDEMEFHSLPPDQSKHWL